MQSFTDENYIYRSQKRGNRANPNKFNSRYWILTLLFKTFEEIVNSHLLHGEKLLDYGCGNKPYKSLFQAKYHQYIAADFIGNREADVNVGLQGQLPISDQNIDCVLSSQVLEHVEDPLTYLGEAYRVLKPNGLLILSTHGFWQYHPDPTDYWRWTAEGLKREICCAGFEIISMHSVFCLASSAVQLWQDATAGKIWIPLRYIYVWFLQSIIGLIEVRRHSKFSDNAAVYIVCARKAEAKNMD